MPPSQPLTFCLISWSEETTSGELSGD